MKSSAKTSGIGLGEQQNHNPHLHKNDAMPKATTAPVASDKAKDPGSKKKIKEPPVRNYETKKQFAYITVEVCHSVVTGLLSCLNHTDIHQD